MRTRIHPDDVALFDHTINRARAAGGDFDGEHRLQMPDHSIEYVRMTGHGIRGDDGRLENIGAAQDVTTQRRLSEERQPPDPREVIAGTLAYVAPELRHERTRRRSGPRKPSLRSPISSTAAPA